MVSEYHLLCTFELRFNLVQVRALGSVEVRRRFDPSSTRKRDRSQAGKTKEA